MTLPNGWAQTTLSGLLHRCEAGKNMRCEERLPRDGERGVVKVSAVTWGRFDPTQSKTLPANYLPPEVARIRNGDLLISRANTIELVGAVAMVDVAPNSLFLSDKVLRLVVEEDAKRWVLWFLRSSFGRKQIEELASGNQHSMRNISQDALRRVRLPVAPATEQRRVVQKIDSLTGKSKRARDHLDHIPRLVEKYKQAVLAAAFARGGGEPVRLGELALPTAPIRYGVLQPGSVKDVGVPMIRICDLQDGKVVWPEVRRIAPTIDKQFSNARVQDGDVLLTVVGTIGRVAVVSGMHEPTNIARAVARIRPNPEKVLSSWLGWRLTNNDCQRTFALDAREVARKTLNVSLVKALSFSAPSLSVQAETVSVIETAFTWIDRLASEATSARKLIDHLDQSVFTKAFRGELVPQDPADEPACVLLERIRAERGAAPKARRGRRAQ
ncbi:hypothetical protein [Mesorhizobium sp.]|uniref:hypothetical protein n=1 Tax=Mesorhizobium sp. TaxID=1871066 RepID=UPI000FE4539C|nr:hypothetical protein [Mesorhizobium sp.]RWK41713.1 MAG: hypothetical protein EOR46_15580 [Mesorhizobium sp.]RWK71068.1 MAG: hypothetical protein EOR54_02820 [Mesorhizobium sp.]RWK76080.1 MAG: hypothetical protein EOR50_15665 [Mesorhizobium sp.]RWK84450.1 MAG: hypothetical protein EOR51_02300 [Mesorhizobium sp.]RWL05061.1 MAG: hypothetical protein EOR55_14085 [Mesorhizobium sp.]